MIGLGEVLHRNGCHLPEMMLFLYVSPAIDISPKDVAPPVMHNLTTWIALLRKFPRFLGWRHLSVLQWYLCMFKKPFFNPSLPNWCFWLS